MIYLRLTKQEAKDVLYAVSAYILAAGKNVPLPLVRAGERLRKLALQDVPKRQKRWRGERPSECDICGALLGFEGRFVWGATTMSDERSVLCPSCHMQIGRGLGPQAGTLYGKDGKDWYRIDV